MAFDWFAQILCSAGYLYIRSLWVCLCLIYERIYVPASRSISYFIMIIFLYMYQYLSIY